MAMMFETLKKFIFRSKMNENDDTQIESSTDSTSSIGSTEPTEPTDSIAIVENVNSLYSIVENGLKDNVSVQINAVLNAFLLEYDSPDATTTLNTNDIIYFVWFRN